MTKMKAQVVEILQDIPDDKVIYVLEMIKGLTLLYSDGEKRKETLVNEQIPTAMGIFNKYANPKLIPKEKDAWGEAVREKYGNY